MVFALPAAGVPPTSVTRTSRMEGTPRWASSMVGTVVTRSSSMMRGLVSAISARTTTPAGRRPLLERSLAALGVRLITGAGGRLPRDRRIRHGALGGWVAMARDEFGLGVRDVQRAGHDDEKEHREREGQYRAAEGPRAARWVSDHSVHSGSLPSLWLSAHRPVLRSCTTERRTEARTATPSGPGNSRWWRRHSARPGTAAPSRSQCTWAAVRRTTGPGYTWTWRAASPARPAQTAGRPGRPGRSRRTRWSTRSCPA